MFEKIKKIKLQDLYSKLQVLREEDLQIQFGSMIPYQKFNWLQKFITQRRKYKQYCSNIQEATQEAEHIKLEKLENLENEIAKIQQSKSFEDLGIEFEEAIEILGEKGIPQILTEADKLQPFTKSKHYQGKYQGLEDFILVHKTNFLPTQSKIRTDLEAGAKGQSTVHLNGSNYNYSYNIERNTIHFAVNGEVSSHSYGNWDNCKYAVLIPFMDVPKQQIDVAEVQDTWTHGGVELTENAYILCPQKEIEKARKLNPSVNIMGYDGERVAGYPEILLSQLGYFPEEVGMWNWVNPRDFTGRMYAHSQEFYQITEKEGIARGTHTVSEAFYAETDLKKINKIVAQMAIIRDWNLVNTPEQAESIFAQLNDSEINYPTINAQITCLNFKRLPELCRRLEVNGIKINETVKSMMTKIQDYNNDTPITQLSDVFPEGVDLAEIPEEEIEKIKTDCIGREGYVPEDSLKLIAARILQKTVLGSMAKEKTRNEIEEDNIR